MNILEENLGIDSTISEVSLSVQKELSLSSFMAYLLAYWTFPPNSSTKSSPLYRNRWVRFCSTDTSSYFISCIFHISAGFWFQESIQSFNLGFTFVFICFENQEILTCEYSRMVSQNCIQVDSIWIHARDLFYLIGIPGRYYISKKEVNSF